MCHAGRILVKSKWYGKENECRIGEIVWENRSDKGACFKTWGSVGEEC